MTPLSLLLSGIVTLSLMRQPVSIQPNKSGSSTNPEVALKAGKEQVSSDPVSTFFFLPSATRTVQESLD